MSSRKVDRRQALAAFGSISLGGLLTACGADGERAAATPTATPPATASPTATPTMEPKTTTSKATSELFDSAGSCSVTAELTEGPYYFDVDSIRSDITEDRDGMPMRLALRVREAGSCEPIENAVVDIWHCDAKGLYSGFESASTGGPGGGRTDQETYLRGAQVTNAEGIVEFKTIYPGWYQGRTIHIHAKVHLDRTTVLTTQLCFADDFSADVLDSADYAGDAGRDVFNANDGLYRKDLELKLSRETEGDGEGVLGVLTFDVRRA